MSKIKEICERTVKEIEADIIAMVDELEALPLFCKAERKQKLESISYAREIVKDLKAVIAKAGKE